MSLNRTSIEYVTHSWNPVTGCMGPGVKSATLEPQLCSYCYAKTIANSLAEKGNGHNQDCMQPGGGLHEKRYRTGKPWRYGFTPTFHDYRLFDPKYRKKPARIFTGDMADMWGDWVPSEWIKEVLKVIRETPQHTYLALTKNPSRYAEFAPLPDNCWAGATVTGAFAGRMPGERVNAEFPKERIARIQWISIEPYLGLPVIWETGLIDWAVIGAMSGPLAKKCAPDPRHLEGLVADLGMDGTPIFMKDSMKPYLEGGLLRQMPDEVR